MWTGLKTWVLNRFIFSAGTSAISLMFRAPRSPMYAWTRDIRCSSHSPISRIWSSEALRISSRVIRVSLVSTSGERPPPRGLLDQEPGEGAVVEVEALDQQRLARTPAGSSG